MDESLTVIRASLRAYMLEMVKICNIKLNIIDLDRKSLDLAGLLYEESMGNRTFVVFSSDKERHLFDVFFIKMGLDSEILQLNILIEPTEALFPGVWCLYGDRVDSNPDAEKLKSIPLKMQAGAQGGAEGLGGEALGPS